VSVPPETIPIPPDHAPSLGDGRYLLASRLGEGGMAGVYRVWDARLKVWRAAKIMLPEFARRRRLRARFEREAHTMARLEHPHLVRVYDVGDVGRVPYLVMELLPGGNLQDWVDRHGRMPGRAATNAVLQVCRGVLAAHAAGVVHRDIKPHNVLIGAEGDCKLADFGIAHADDENLTRTGSTMGTLGYMPPEQRKDAKSVDVRADIYSLGATLWYLLTAQTVVDLFLCEDDPTKLAGVPEPLRPVIRTAVAYDRDSRQPDVTTLVAELNAALGQLPPDPPAPPLPEALERAPAEARDGFPELRLMFEEATGPASVSSDGNLRGPEQGAALPYFMPTADRAKRRIDFPPDASPGPVGRPEARRDDTLPDYVDREALSEEATADPLPPVMVPPSELTDPGPAPEPTRRSAAPWLAGGGAAIVGLLVVGGVCWTAADLVQSRSEALAAREALYDEIDGMGPVVDELVRLGVERSALEAPYFTYLDTTSEPERAEAALTLVQSVRAATERVSSGEAGRGASAKSVDRLSASHDAFTQQVAAWRADTEGLVGGLLYGLGVGAAELPTVPESGGGGYVPRPTQE